MKHLHDKFGISIITTFLLFSLFSCPLPLMDEIEEDVKIVITPPSVKSIYPNDNSTNIPINLETISITFTKAIQSSSISSSTFSVKDEANSVVSGLFSISNDTVTFHPNEELEYGSTYTIYINTGIKDTDGNPLTEPFSWTFSTGIAPDTTPPVINSILINSGDIWTNNGTVEIQIDASDDTEIAQINVSNSISFSDSGWATFQNPYTWELSSGEGTKNVYVKLRDGANNTTSSYSTDSILVDQTVPEISSFLLDNGRAGTQNDTISLNLAGFDDEGGSGIYSFRLSDTPEVWQEWQTGYDVNDDGVIDESDDDVFSDGSILIDAYPLSVSSGEVQTFKVEIQDQAGNVSSESVSQIRLDRTGPSIESVVPASGETVPQNSSLVYVVFDEEIDPASFTAENFYLAKGGIILSDRLEFSNSKTAVYLSDIELDQNSDYTVYLGSDITDSAGNALGSEYIWYFHTNFAIDTTPPEGMVVLNIDQPDFNATSAASVNLHIKATDDYNSVYGVKIWGDNDNSDNFPRFEDQATWKTYVENNTSIINETDYMDFNMVNFGNWILDALAGSSGIKNIYYRFLDSAGNESATPGRLIVFLDQQNPALDGVIIDDGSGYTNNEDETVILNIDAADDHSGLKELWISETDYTGSPETAPWQDWSPVVGNYDVYGEGTHTLFVQVRDHVNLLSPVVSANVVVDLTSPSASFDENDILEVNDRSLQSGDFSDTPVDGGQIASYLWEEVGETDNVQFYPDQTSEDEDPTVDFPWIEATKVGEYELKVTLTDYAGNTTFTLVPFIWDTIAPGDPEGTAPTVYAPSYSTNSQPVWTWDEVVGANYYKVSFNSAPDWNNPADYQIIEGSSFSPDAPGRSDGTSNLKVSAWDTAGNNTSTGEAASFIDTVPPVILGDGQLFLTSSLLTINYAGTDSDANGVVDGSEDGAVYDPGSPTMGGSTGSDIDSATYQWSASGPGTLTISDADTLAPSFSADTDGQYQISFSVADLAGNSANADFIFEWDTVAPDAPVVSGVGSIVEPAEPDVTKTPSVTPTWSWSSGGNGGSGTFRYRMDRADEFGSIEETDVIPWTEINGTSFTPSVSLVDPDEDGVKEYDNKHFILYVQEKDAAENWSAADSASIWVDTTFTSSPSVIRDGGYLRNSAQTSVTWNLISGLGDLANELYRYRLDPGNPWTELLTDQTSIQIDFASNGTDDGVYTLEVEEQNTTDTTWVEKIGTSDVQIDATAPSAPTVSGTSPTNDTTPTFNWSYGSDDGIRVYRYSFDGGTWSADTTSTSYTLSSALANGSSHTLDVQERDQAGNWSISGSRTVTIDTAAPTISSFYINSGNPSYTNIRGVTLNIGAAGDPSLMRFSNNSGVSWSSWEAYSSTKSWTLLSGDGSKEVSVQLQDAAGNSAFAKDYIYLDMTNPVINSFSIINNANTTSSTSVTLNSSVSGANSMRMKNGLGGTWSSWYTYASSMSWKLSSGVQTKKVYAEFKDYAGNTVSTTDAIFYGTPSILYATKGAYDNGDIKVYYNTYGSESGTATNSYRILYATSPIGTKNVKTSSAVSSPYTMTGMTKGTLYYIFVQVHNSEVGYSEYSSYAPGFTSDVTVIYDSTDSGDISVANSVKSLLTWTTFPDSYSSYISGSMPAYTVTLFPENLVSTNWYTGDDRNIIYGDPVIITPSTSLYTSSVRVQNVLHRSGTLGSPPSNLLPSTRYDTYTIWGWNPTTGMLEPLGTGYDYHAGIIAMGYGGAKFLDTAEVYWSSYGYPTSSLTDITQYPTEIGAGESMTTSSADSYMYQWTDNNPNSDNFVWRSPLYSTIIVGGSSPTHNASVQITYDTLENRHTVYRSTDTDPVNGQLLMRDNYSSNPHYFPVVRQGRFLQYGFPVLLDRPYTGKVFFVNITALMDNY